MMNSDVMSEPRVDARPGANPRRFAVDTLAVAAVATAATWGSTTLKLEVWVMFAGLIAWFSRPETWRSGAGGLLCMWLGLVAGAGCFAANDAFLPWMGVLALPLVVFVVSVVVVGLRATPVVNNMLAWFVGLVTVFAAQLKPSAEGLLHLGAASLVGGLAGLLCHTLAPRLEPPGGVEAPPR